jgi:hypothetical protein
MTVFYMAIAFVGLVISLRVADPARALAERRTPTT